MGRFAMEAWRPGRVAALDRGVVAVALAALPVAVSLGRRQALERRSNLAEPDRSRLPLLDPTAAHAGRLVHGAVAGVVSKSVGSKRLRVRATGSPPHLLSATGATGRRGSRVRLPGAHRGYRQLLLL